MTNYSIDTVRTRFILGHPDWEIEIQGSEHIGRDFDAWVRKLKAEALRGAASNARYELGTEASGHTSTYSVRRWLDSEANRIERGE